MQIPQTVKAHRDSYRITVGFSMPAALFQIFIEESFQLLERDGSRQDLCANLFAGSG